MRSHIMSVHLLCLYVEFFVSIAWLKGIYLRNEPRNDVRSVIYVVDTPSQLHFELLHTKPSNISNPNVFIWQIWTSKLISKKTTAMEHGSTTSINDYVIHQRKLIRKDNECIRIWNVQTNILYLWVLHCNMKTKCENLWFRRFRKSRPWYVPHIVKPFAPPTNVLHVLLELHFIRS